MEPNNKNQQPGSPGNDPEEFIDEVTKNKIDRHLHDINDTISENDIKNIITDISSSDVTWEDRELIDEPPLEDSEKKEKDEDEKKEKDGLDKKEMPSSWDIME